MRGLIISAPGTCRGASERCGIFRPRYPLLLFNFVGLDDDLPASRELARGSVRFFVELVDWFRHASWCVGKLFYQAWSFRWLLLVSEIYRDFRAAAFRRTWHLLEVGCVWPLIRLLCAALSYMPRVPQPGRSQPNHRRGEFMGSSSTYSAKTTSSTRANEHSRQV